MVEHDCSDEHGKSGMASLEYILRNFQFERVLSHDTRTKLVYVLGRVEDKPAILSFERMAYDDKLCRELAARTRGLKDAVENNIYGWAEGTVSFEGAPDTHIKSIFPATELHVSKYSEQARLMVVETPALYENITLPYIQQLPAERIQWVRNILDGTSEADRVIYRQEKEFVILPDMKWDGSPESLYWVAIADREDILSLRSLTQEHLGLLKAIRAAACRLAQERYGMTQEQLRLFVHYQPSYYHFHVHITALSFVDAPGVFVGQAHLLDTVINNIEMYNDYYQRATLPFTIGERHPLYALFQDAQSGE